MEFFMAMVPPTVTHQEKQVHVVKGKPVFYEPADLKAARQKLMGHLAGHRPEQQKINIKRVESYSEIYISNQTNIKPRALHTLNQRTEQALKEWEVSLERRPKIIIVSPDEMPTAYGKYDAIQNVVFYIPQIADSKVIKDQGNVEFHEMWHMKQAENFRKRYGEITRENYGKYIENACKEAKKTIDRAGITEYNVSDISSYADQMFWIDRYDEVEAEYMVKHRRGKKHGNSQVSGGDSKGDGNL